MGKLTDKKRAVLRILTTSRGELASGPEISVYLRWKSEAATPVLNSLAKEGLVKRLGKSFSNAWCWAITDAGRAALKETVG